VIHVRLFAAPADRDVDQRFDVEVRDRRVRRRPGRRIRGVGDFTDLRQLRLIPDDN
jgi:hypothetical protein